MSDRITLAGRVGKNPELRRTKSSEDWLSFRVASTPRVRSEQGTWSDGETSWYSVNAYGALARNAAESLHQGERVVVTGDLTVRSWTTADGRTGVTAQIRAVAIGHDLTFGTSSLGRAAHRPDDPQQRQEEGSAEQPAPAPIDRSGQWATPMGDDPAEEGPDAEPSWASAS
jgi:single-strand DNA-binding protein